MKIENLVNYSYNTVNEFYSQGMISQAQWEAYDFAWANTHITTFPYHYSLLLQDARDEFWKLYKVLPAKLQKLLRPLAIG